MFWNQYIEDKGDGEISLTRLWCVEGKTMEEIAEIFTKHLNRPISRNSIASQISRNKLTKKNLKSQGVLIKENRGRPKIVSTTKFEPIPETQKHFYTSTQAIGKFPPSGHCLWGFGDPKEADFHFCGEKTIPGKPYCECHQKQAYV